jgi:radical SAM superfamily enzyme YgiQ (UPF0313 family)
MAEVRKAFNRVGNYSRLIQRVHAHGIAVQVGIVFGFDSDTTEIFEAAVDLLEETGVQNATFNMLTPYPGTPLFAKLEAQGRMLTRDWSRLNGRTDVVFHPQQMSPAELLEGFQYANQRFCSLPSVAKRLSRSPVQLGWTLPLNLAYAAKWASARREAESRTARSCELRQASSV